MDSCDRNDGHNQLIRKMGGVEDYGKEAQLQRTSNRRHNSHNSLRPLRTGIQRSHVSNANDIRHIMSKTYIIILGLLVILFLIFLVGPNLFQILSHRDEESLNTKYPIHPLPADSITLSQQNKVDYTLIIAIVTSPVRTDRRKGLRETWMKDCSRADVLCRFFTDKFDEIEPWSLQTEVQNESSTYNDIEFMPIPKGYNFGWRMLWLLEWAMRKYTFHFFMRLDDDYFVCLRRLLMELPRRLNVQRLYWGYIHCHKGQVRADEAFLLLSYELVKDFVSNKDNLMCLPYGDQSVALWLNPNRYGGVVYFHDSRIMHEHSLLDDSVLEAAKNVCNVVLGIHKTYVSDNHKYWETAKGDTRTAYRVPSIPEYTRGVCSYDKFFDWKAMDKEYRTKPLPCSRHFNYYDVNKKGLHETGIKFN